MQWTKNPKLSIMLTVDWESEKATGNKLTN